MKHATKWDLLQHHKPFLRSGSLPHQMPFFSLGAAAIAARKLNMLNEEANASEIQFGVC
jgi:hypothetical protein